MEAIHIFSGNIPTLACAYLHEIYSNQNKLNVNFYNQANESQHNRFENRSIAIFDSNCHKNRLYRFGNWQNDHLGGNYSSLSQSGSTHSHEKDHASGFNLDSLTEKPSWNGKVDVFEQANNSVEYSSEWNNSYFLTKLLGEKNVHKTKTISRNYSNGNTTVGLMNDSYNLNIENSGFECDEILEMVRHKLEDSDQNRVIHLFTEVDSIYSNISNEIFEFLDEEAPHSYKPSLALQTKENKNITVEHVDLYNALSFANVRFLLDQNNFCDDIWLIDLKYIEEQARKGLNTNFNSLDAISFAMDQISAVTGHLNDALIHHLNVIGRSVRHPFRNIAMFNPLKSINANNTSNILKGTTLESVFSNYFLDACQSEYFGVDLLESSEIISVVNESPYVFGKETENIINYLSLNTKMITNNSVSDKETFPISVMHAIYNIEKSKLINNLLKRVLNCKNDSRSLYLIKTYYNLEPDEINTIFESVLTWLDN